MNPGSAVLYVPADNERAIAKAPTTDATALIYDLEDAVGPTAKANARETLRRVWENGSRRVRAIRINGIDTPHFTEDLLLARKLMPDAIVLPKVESATDLTTLGTALAEADAPRTLRIWAMIETPLGVLNVGEIARFVGRLDGLILGSNDLATALGVFGSGMDAHLALWRPRIVLAARAGGVFALDGVTNELRDSERIERDARNGAALGFDGKTLIHPAQIAPTLAAYRPSGDRIAEARAIVAAFGIVGEDVGVTTVGDRLVERLHVAAARRDLAKIGEPE